MSVRVAPREISDYVERAARVGGCGLADAGLLADAVTSAEVHGGGGLAAFLAAPDHVDLAAAIRSLDEVALGVADSASHVVATNAPHVLLGMSVHQWCRHGVIIDLTPVGTLDAVEIRRGSATPDVSRRAEYRRALAHGVDVDAHLWEHLVSIAADFLVAESILDALT